MSPAPFVHLRVRSAYSLLDGALHPPKIVDLAVAALRERYESPEDLVIATSPTGFLTIDVSGLNPDQTYVFTLYAWDPGAGDASDKVWTVTGGSGDPATAAVNFQDPLVDNDSFIMPTPCPTQ